MRRHDKKIHIDRVNKLFEQRCNESKFNWNGKYANENDHEEAVEEGDVEDYNYPFNVDSTIDNDDVTDPYKIKEAGVMMLGNDMENMDEVDTTDVEASTFFSDVEGEMMTDKELDS